ncbi:hypothetical protein DXG01_009924 [Tephrocybe rancida]|nr:hypothetical protein DXG01_009924 [Tephrocybe rancida]
MASVNFKLTEHDGLTRRVAFPAKPTWNTLAAKIELLFGIPIEKVSVAYTDADDDLVTLSSQEELDDFYTTSHTGGQVIKFTVQDLTTARLQRTLSQPTQNPNRNTFGIGAFDIEDDWQTLPVPPISGLQGLFIPNPSDESHPHAFVEVLESDAGTVRNDGPAERRSTASSVASSPGSPFIVPLDKGKQRAATDDDVSSTGSVLGEDAPPKPPVHVYDFQTPIVSDSSPLPPHYAAESTPKATTQNLETAGPKSADVPEKSFVKEDEDPTDPPLNPLGEEPPHVSTTFSNDVTSLLTTFSSVIAAHPELSEGIRNIVRNTSNGSYWQSQRAAFSQSAQNIARDTGMAAEAMRRETEEEAGRRIAEALGGVFRTLSQTLNSTHVDAEPATTPMPPTTAQPSDDVPEEPTLAQGEDSVPPVPPRSFIPEHDPPRFDHWMHRGSGHWGQRAQFSAPFGPPLGPYGPRRPMPPAPPPHASWHGWAPRPSPPGFFPPAPPPPPPPPSALQFIPPPPLPMEHHVQPQLPKMTPQELRAQVDEAKARYREEKEKYRLEREERRKEREMRSQMAAELITNKTKPAAPPLPVRPSTPPAVAVHGRFGQPTHEVVSVQRHHTHLGHGSSRRHHTHGHEHSDLRTRAVNRITKRLADMGFSENTHPELPTKIKAQLPSDGFVRNDSEDDIVTTLLEDLLAMSPKPQVASGSGVREVPGGWH